MPHVVRAGTHARTLRRLPWTALAAIAFTTAACLAALVCRAPLRYRYWAWRLAGAGSAAQRSAYLAALCNAGPDARWAAAALLADADPAARQYGVLVLHHLRTPWSRARLVERLADPDSGVRHLAAVGLAIHGDEAVIPTLTELYRAGEGPGAATACIALQYLGTPAAVTALAGLAALPAAAESRAALVEALAGVGTPECVPALVALLADHRRCAAAPHAAEVAQRARTALLARGYAVAAATQPSSGQEATVAERAAATLAAITGIEPPFSSGAAEAERAAAAAQWSAWRARQAPDNRPAAPNSAPMAPDNRAR